LCLVCIGGVTGLSSPLLAQDLEANRETAAPPDALSGGIRGALSGEAAVVTRGTQRLRFWWVRSAGLATASTTPEWSQVEPGTLVGAMELTEALPDIRGVPIAPGVYTLRFAMQPQDGDHLGVSPYRQFLVVAPAGEDLTPEPVGQDRAVSLGKKTQKRSHPAVLSIDPPRTQEQGGAVVTTENGHRAIVASIPATHSGQPAGTLSFGVILVGRIEH
jgi:hypothetical protein